MKTLIPIILIAAAFNSAYAGKFYVNQTAPAGGNGLSWASAFSDVQPALEAAQSGDSILVAKGIYLPSKDAAGGASPSDARTRTFAVKSGVLLYGGFLGGEPDMTGRNPVANLTTLSGDLGASGSPLDNAYHVVTSAANVLIDGFTVTSGNADGSGENAQSGAFYKSDGMFIVNCVIADNSAVFGGALTVFGDAPVQVTNSTFSGNQATSAGAIVDITSSTAAVSFTNTVFRHNFSGSNGAIYNTGASPVFINCIFDSNFTAASPYGLYSDGGSPQIVNCVVYSDRLYSNTEKTGQMTITNCIVWGNAGIPASASVSYSCLASSRTGTGNIAGDPLFVNAPAGDFHIKKGSPCIDKADGSQAPALDFDGIPRYDYPNIANVDEAFADIGAFECVTPNSAPVITGAHLNGGLLGESIIVTLDSLTVLDNDNVYPDDFTLIVGTGRYTRSNSTRTSVTLKPTSDSAGILPIPVRVWDNIDTSAVYMIYIPVKRRVVYVDAAATGLNNGSSWKNAYPNLLMAMQLAPTTSEIWVAKGTYTPVLGDTETSRMSTFTLVSKGSPLYGGFAGNETELSQRNWRVNESILSGDIGRKGDSSDNCIHVLRGADNAILDGFVITGGNADSSIPSPTIIQYAFFCGGGMFNDGANPTINNCTFRRNYALGGGAIFNFSGSSPKITNCIFCYNWATDTDTGKLTDRRGGGAIFNNWSTNPVITNCVFYRNSVTSNGWGAAIYHYWSDNMKVTNCTFFNNSDAGNTRTGFAAEWGGATLTNSILVNTTIGNLDNRGPTAVSYSCLPPRTTMAGTGNVFVVPRFVDTAANDFHLSSSSLCIDQASGAAAPSHDLEGRTRYDHPECDNIDASFVDIGAYEYNPHPTQAQPKKQAPPLSDRYSLELASAQSSRAAILISYALPASVGAQDIHFSIFDCKGVRIAHALVTKSAGSYRFPLGFVNIQGKPGIGFYFCRMQAGNVVVVKKFFIFR